MDELILKETGTKEEKMPNGEKQAIPVCLLTGSTANVLLITPTHFYVANCGDSRSALLRNKECYELS